MQADQLRASVEKAVSPPPSTQAPAAQLVTLGAQAKKQAAAAAAAIGNQPGAVEKQKARDGQLG